MGDETRANGEHTIKPMGDVRNMLWEFGIIVPIAYVYEKNFAQCPNIRSGQDFNGNPEPR
jgi:hypothetical protein